MTRTEPAPAYRVFTDSILTDLAALPEEAQAEVAAEVLRRYRYRVAAVDWAALVPLLVVPLALFLPGHFHASAYVSGLVLGIVATVAFSGLSVFAQSVHWTVTAYLHHRTHDASREG